jgi:hypothetical protein
LRVTRWQIPPCRAAIALFLATAIAMGAVDAQTLPSRFTLKAKVSLVPAAQSDVDGSIEVNAKLTPADAEPLLLTDNGGRMQLTAALSKVTSTCYGDTIFEDDFDGDGF